MGKREPRIRVGGVRFGASEVVCAVLMIDGRRVVIEEEDDDKPEPSKIGFKSAEKPMEGDDDEREDDTD
jgi:hypothetical protein